MRKAELQELGVRTVTWDMSDGDTSNLPDDFTHVVHSAIYPAESNQEEMRDRGGRRPELDDEHGSRPLTCGEVLTYAAGLAGAANDVAREVECHGTRVPAGAVMLLLNGSANRDDRRYPDADTFDIHRGAAHLSFGHGLHFCLGSALARMQARVVLEEVVQRWPDWEIDYANAVRARTSSVRGCPCLPASCANRCRPGRRVVRSVWVFRPSGRSAILGS